MSYSENANGQVVLTLSREDYQLMLMLLGAGAAGARIVSGNRALAFLNRLNEGNPHYTPYQVDENLATQSPRTPK